MCFVLVTNINLKLHQPVKQPYAWKIICLPCDYGILKVVQTRLEASSPHLVPFLVFTGLWLVIYLIHYNMYYIFLTWY